MGFIQSWIRNISLFLIFSSLIDFIIPQNQYKKYIRLTMGFIFMIVMIKPILSLSNQNIVFDIYQNQHQYEQHEIEQQLKRIDDENQKIILTEYKSKIYDQVQRLLEQENVKIAEFSVEIVEDQNSQEFGQIKKMELMIAALKESSEIEGDSLNSGNTEGTEATGEIEIIKKNIKNLLVNFYNLSGDNIYITVQKNF